MPDAMNYYVVLGVDEDAAAETIRSAYRGLVRRYHPDAGAGSSASEFRRVVEAYETLNDPERRQGYDRALRRRRTPARHVEPLGNRVPLEPIVATWSTTSGFQHRETVRSRRVAVDDRSRQPLLTIELAIWLAGRF